MIINFVHRAEEKVPGIPEPSQRQEFLKECSRNGGIIPEGFPVYRGDTRDIEVIRQDGGFVPSTFVEKGKTLVQNARTQAERILAIDAGLFLTWWKYSGTCPAEYSELILGQKGRLAGVAFGCNGGQKGGHEYEVRLPKMYALKANMNVQKTQIVCVYGDQLTINASTFLWMHLVQMRNAEEIVSLTTIPIERIVKIK